tara:strand:+ start:228 stop:419 length:192 start_codon:yes stop_codon:yes gene_type:complete
MTTISIHRVESIEVSTRTLNSNLGESTQISVHCADGVTEDITLFSDKKLITSLNDKSVKNRAT